MKEVKEHRYAGPFEKTPFENFIQSPVGLVPKSGGKMRLIFHLSFDFGPENKSLNYHTPKDKCSVKYNDLDAAIKECLHILREAEEFPDDASDQLVFAKSDCSNVLPVLVYQCRFLILKATHPITGKTLYFVDKCLPFGASISCALFQEFSDVLKHITQWKITLVMKISNPTITNYLDDFLFIVLTFIKCNGMVSIFLEVCEGLGCPISMEY